MARGSCRLIAGALLAAALVGVAPSVGGAEQAATYTVDAHGEAEFVGRINQLRASKGLPAVEVDPELTAIGRSWAEAMAEAGSISHNPDFAEQVTADWQKLGENVGSGPDVPSIHDAFVRSGSHYRNLVDPDFTFVGVGVVRDPDGVIFTAHQFMQLRSAPPPAPPASAPPAQPASTGSAAALSPPSAPEAPSAPSAASVPRPPLPPPPVQPALLFGVRLPAYWPGPGPLSAGRRAPDADAGAGAGMEGAPAPLAGAATATFLGCAALLVGRRRQTALIS